MNAREFTGVLYTFTVKEVTIPNEPPPPPRIAQNKSGLLLELATTADPLAITTVIDRTLSIARPNFLTVRPLPPPVNNPPTPAPGLDPLGK